MKPASGRMYWWRPKGAVEWRFGYCTHDGCSDLVRMGRWNGDTSGGYVVSAWDIDWKDYQ